MPTGITTTAQIDKAVRTFVAKALEVRENAPVMPRLVDSKTLPRKSGATYAEPFFNALVAAALTDGVELDSPQQLLDEQITISPGEVGLQTLITKRTNDIVSEDLFGLAGRVMQNALSYKQDRDLLSLLDGFSGTIGGGTATMVPGHIAAAAVALRTGRPVAPSTLRSGARATGDPAPPPFYAVIHDYQWYDLAAQQSGLYKNASAIGTSDPGMNFAISDGSVSDYQRRWIEEHYMGTFHGVKVMTDNNMDVTSNATKSAVFAKEALIFLNFRGLNKKVVETDDGRANKITLTDDYGYGERNDAWGVELWTAAVSPTT